MVLGHQGIFFALHNFSIKEKRKTHYCTEFRSIKFLQLSLCSENVRYVTFANNGKMNDFAINEYSSFMELFLTSTHEFNQLL